MKNKKISVIEINAFIEGYKNNEKAKKVVLYSMMLMTFIILWILNSMSGYYADDYYYLSQKIEIGSVFKEAVQDYNFLNGRFLASIMTYTFLAVPKMIFNFVNSIIMTSVTVLMYKHCMKGKEIRPSFYVLVISSCWLFFPHIHHTMFNLCASINHLWPMCAILIFLLPYKCYLENQFSLTKKQEKIFICFMFIVGIISGCGVENGSGACLLFVIIVLLVYRFKKIKYRLWHWVGFMGCAIGLVLLISAPGNAVKIAGFDAPHSYSLMEVINRIRYATQYLLDNYLMFIICFIILTIFIVDKRKKEKLEYFTIYFFVFIASFYALVLAPIMPERAWLSSCIFLLIAMFGCFARVDFLNLINRKIINSLILLISAYAFSVLFTETVNIMQTYEIYVQRELYFEKEKEKGNFDMIIPKLPQQSKYVASEILNEEVYNTAYCVYNEINSVKLVPYEERKVWLEWINRNQNMSYDDYILTTEGEILHE